VSSEVSCLLHKVQTDPAHVKHLRSHRVDQFGSLSTRCIRHSNGRAGSGQSHNSFSPVDLQSTCGPAHVSADEIFNHTPTFLSCLPAPVELLQRLSCGLFCCGLTRINRAEYAPLDDERESLVFMLFSFVFRLSYVHAARFVIIAALRIDGLPVVI